MAAFEDAFGNGFIWPSRVAWFRCIFVSYPVESLAPKNFLVNSAAIASSD